MPVAACRAPSAVLKCFVRRAACGIRPHAPTRDRCVGRLCCRGRRVSARAGPSPDPRDGPARLRLGRRPPDLARWRGRGLRAGHRRPQAATPTTSSIWVVPADGGAPRRPMTVGRRDTRPAVVAGRAAARLSARGRERRPTAAGAVSTCRSTAASPRALTSTCRRRDVVCVVAGWPRDRVGSTSSAADPHAGAGRPRASDARIVTRAVFRPTAAATSTRGRRTAWSV